MLASVPGFTINVAYIPSLFWKGVPGSCPFESVPRSANTKAERKAKQTSTWEVTLLVVLLKVKKIQFTECNKKSKYKSTIRQVHGRQLCSSSFCGGIVLVAASLHLVAASLHSLAPPPTHHPLHDFGFHCATLGMSIVDPPASLDIFESPRIGGQNHVTQVPKTSSIFDTFLFCQGGTLLT